MFPLPPCKPPVCLLALLSAGVLTGLLTGCATYHISVPAYRLIPAHPDLGHFIAGASRTDITPPAGFPMGGHGPAGRVARGYWTRLYARAFYFDDGQGHHLALVSAELFAIPAGLRAQVLAAVNRRQRLRPEELVLAATHTHHGPANFASAEVYNSFAGPLPNFSPVLLDFLSAQIAEAIVESIADARAHAGLPHELRIYQGSAPGIQRNRAVAPFFHNPEPLRTAILDHSLSLGAACPDGATHGCPRYLAADPTLQLVEIVRAGVPRALLMFFAVHPTAITHDADLYSSDLAGIACAALEQNRAPVAGFFNGAEGDISPDWLVQDRDDALRLASRLVTAVFGLLSRAKFQTDPAPAIEVRQKTVPTNWRDSREIGFVPQPMSGAAELGGAEDGRTIFYNFGWRAEARKPVPQGDHGVKEPGLDGPMVAAAESLDAAWLARAVKTIRPSRFVKSRIYPDRVPVTWARLGSFRVSAIPVEATTAVGWALRRETGADVIVGLANEYLGYTTTAAEYQAQQYEGASTLLGAGQAEALSRLLTLAATGHADPPSTDLIPARNFRAGPRRKLAFGPETLLVSRPRNMVDEDLEPLLPPALRREEARIPRFDWQESPAGDWHTAIRQVAIYALDHGIWRQLETDRGLSFLTVLAEATPITRRYTVLWIPSAPATPAQILFQVRTAADQQLCSQPFTLAAIPTTAPVPPIPQAPCPQLPATDWVGLAW